MLSLFLSVLWISMELTSCLLFNATFLPLKRNKKTVLITGLLVLLIMIVYSNIGMNALLKQVVTIAVISGASMFLFRGKLITHCLLVGICYILLNVFDSIVAYGMCFLLDVTFLEYVWLKLTYITFTTIGKFVYILLCWMAWRYRSLGELQNVQVRWLVLILFFPLVSIVLLVLTIFSAQAKEDISVGVVVFSAILALANIAILYILNMIEATTKREKDMELLKQQIALQTENFLALENSYKTQRKSTHEFQRHLQALQDLLSQGEYDTAFDYLSKLQTSRTMRTICINSHHPVIDIILNQKYQLAQDYNIKMQVQVNDLSGIAIPTDALVVLFSNLLDNAIEACQRYEDRREIYCTIIHNDVLYFAIRNTSLPIEFVSGEIKSSKAKGLEHGYGIPAVKYILDQLAAEYTFEYNNGWFQFVAEIQL